MKDTQQNNRSRWKTLRLAIFWGIISVVLYLLVFLNQAAVTQHFTRGGAYAIAIVAIALIFSLIYGSFASHVISLSGIRPWQGKDKEKGEH
jgi:uncharacterized membrane protein HdeD (DUF308 family)